MPPAATTGTGATASTTAGTSARVAVVPRTWPPASQPWATMTSAPASAARTASATLPTLIIRRAPASWIRPASGAGSPQNSETIGHALVEHRLDLLGDVEGEHDIGDEGPVGRLAQAPDPGARLFAAPAGEAERAEAAGVRYRGGERRPGGAADRGLDHGDVDSEPFAERRPHRNPSAPDGEV